jgi:hypothetical protein
MASGSNEVEQCVHTIVSEPRVTLDSRFFGKNVIVLALEVSNNRGETGFIVNLVTKSRGVNNGERDACAFFVEL